MSEPAGARGPGGSDQIELAIDGMTCASCVARVEKRLNRVPGASATVNLATEQAHVELTEPVRLEDLIAAVQRAGYDARLLSSTVQPTRASAATTEITDDGGPSPRAATPADARAAARGEKAMPEAPATHTHTHGETPSQAHHAIEAPSQAHAHDHTEASEDLRRRLIVAIVLTIPVTAISMISPLQFPGWQWVVAAGALPVATWCAWPFHRAAARAGRHGASTMDTLVSIGVIAATVWSLWALLLGGAGEIGAHMRPTLVPAALAGHEAMPELYFETAAVVTTFLLAGRYAESRARRRAGAALRALLDLGAKDVAVLDDAGTESRIPIEQLRVGQLFTVRPGEKVATDGVIIAGTSAIDASLVTGEPVPIDVGPQDPVTGATINTAGHLVLRATRVGADTQLAQIARMVTAAQTGKAPVQRLADRISAVFVPVVMVIALVTVAIWLLSGGGVQAAFTAGVAVLIIACPCALGLATPTALLVGSGRGAQLGIVIKGPQILESTRRVDTIVLDKTGTLTEGRMHLVAVHTADGPWQLRGELADDDAAGSGGNPDGPRPGSGPAPIDVVRPDLPTAGFDPSAVEALRLAAAVESLSEHPIAQAIARAGRGFGQLPAASDFANHAGRGVSARVEVSGRPDRPLADSGMGGHPATATDGLEVRIGRPDWLVGSGLKLPAELAGAVESAGRRGASAVLVGWDGRVRAALEVRDTPKASAAPAIAELNELGLRPVLLTGDNAAAAHQVAREVGIADADVIAEVLPQDKVTQVTALQRAGHVVAMAGDGVNDAAALATADLGLAMGSGTDVAIEAADITIVRGDLGALPQAIRLSRRTLRIIKQNLFWAFAYNTAAIPLAAIGWLNPMIAGAAMAASSVLVVSNSLRLRRFR